MSLTKVDPSTLTWHWHGKNVAIGEVDLNKAVTMKVEGETDFYQNKVGGFFKDDGHLYYSAVTGNFSISAKITGKYVDLYDQAGFMVRVDAKNWIKCGIEMFDGIQQASAVVTKELSDWSVSPLADNPASIHLKVSRKHASFLVEISTDGKTWSFIRKTYADWPSTINLGLFAACPNNKTGFNVTWEDLSLSITSSQSN